MRWIETISTMNRIASKGTVRKGGEQVTDRSKSNRNHGRGMALGVVLGVAIGTAMGNISIGVAFGLVLGAALESSENKKK